MLHKQYVDLQTVSFTVLNRPLLLLLISLLNVTEVKNDVENALKLFSVLGNKFGINETHTCRLHEHEFDHFHPVVYM